MTLVRQETVDALASTSGWNAEQVALIKETVAKGANDSEFRLFMAICGRSGLDPFTRQIHFIKYGNAPGTTVTGIDGYRLIAQRSGEYRGQVGPQWCGSDGAWRDVWLAAEPPAAARVGVWREGFKEPAWGVARWTAYKAQGPMWQKMGAEQLAKCAEALALRKAFPNELSALYTREEMAQAKHETVEVEAEVVDSTTGEVGTGKPMEARDWHDAFVSLCREHGYVGRGAKKVALNDVLRAMGGGERVVTPPNHDAVWQVCVEWLETNAWPEKRGAVENGTVAAPGGAPEPGAGTAPAAPTNDAGNGADDSGGMDALPAARYWSASAGQWLTIRDMPIPHVVRAIQVQEQIERIGFAPDAKNNAATLDALRMRLDLERGPALGEKA